MTNFLISFFALYREEQTLIDWGALFQTLAESFINVCFARQDVPGSTKFPLVADLEFICPTFYVIFRELMGLTLSLLRAFHVSVSLIWAFNWLMDSRFRFSMITVVLILSDILVLLRNLNILFWVFWISRIRQMLTSFIRLGSNGLYKLFA